MVFFRKHRDLWQISVPGLVFAFIFFLMVYRSLFGFDWSDETYMIAMGYRISLGQTLFVDLQDAHQTSGLLVSFFISIFRFVTGSMEGTILFLRIIYLLIVTAIAVFSYRVFLHFAPRSLALSVSLCLMVFAPFSIGSLHYNSLLFCFFVLTVLCLMQTSNSARPFLFSFLAGCSFGMGVVAYPLFLIVLPFFLFYIAFVGRRLFLRPVVLFLAGGTTIFIALSVYILLTTGFSGFVHNIANIAMPRLTLGYNDADRSKTFLALAKEGIRVAHPAFLGIGCIFAGFCCGMRGKKTIRASAYLSLCAVMALHWLAIAQALRSDFQVRSYDPIVMINHLGFFAALWLPLLVLACPSVMSARLLLGVWVPALITSYAVHRVVAYTKLSSYFPMTLAAVCVPICVYSALDDLLKLPFHAPMQKWTKRFLPLGMALLLLGGLGWMRMRLVYRDEPLAAMTQTLSAGPGAGLRTTPDRAHDYQRLLADMRRDIVEEDRLLMVGAFAVGYIMTDAVPATDVVTRNNWDSSHVVDYYQRNPARLPTVVYALDEERQYYMSPPENTKLLDYLLSLGYMPQKTDVGTVYRRESTQ